MTISSWLKDFGLSIWKLTLFVGTVSAVNIYGYVSNIPRPMWGFLDYIFMINYAAIFSLCIVASVFFANWTTFVINFLLRSVTFGAKVIGVTKSERPMKDDSFFMGLSKILIFCLSFSYLFSGPDFLSEAVNNLLIMVLLQFGYLFYIFATKVQPQLAGRNYREYLGDFLIDLSLTSWPKFIGLSEATVPVFLLLGAIYSYKLGEARYEEITSDLRYAVATSGLTERVVVAVTSNGVIFLQRVRSGAEEKDEQSKDFKFETYSGHVMISVEVKRE